MSSLWVSRVSGIQEDEGNFKYKIKVMEEKTRGIVTASNGVLEAMELQDTGPDK